MRKLIFAIGLSVPMLCWADGVDVPINATSDGHQVGTIHVEDSPYGYGLVLTPHLKGLNPGLHGFHIHENPSCDMKGDGAGGHLDPEGTGKHLGPYNPHGHLGDLPVMAVDQDGNADVPVLAPRLSLDDIKGHSFMIHEGGDNYSDKPKPLGGGGGRMYCGVIAGSS